MSKFFRRKPNSAKDENNFDTEIKQKPKCFVLFYASWCPYSQRFLPIFQKYAKTNPQECISVVIDDREDLCDEYAIEYYPTVLLFKNGNVYKRLDPEPHVGLSQKQLEELTKTQ
jgi:thiol-disulfide isomerase/thioredoxin